MLPKKGRKKVNFTPDSIKGGKKGGPIHVSEKDFKSIKARSRVGWLDLTWGRKNLSGGKKTTGRPKKKNSRIRCLRREKRKSFTWI